MDQVEQIKGKIDIVALISEFIPVKKAGRNFKANCPFHGEKTPSFMVSPERQIWHCFGCGKGGDAYSFLMEYERLEFPEALRLLAKRAGIELVTTHVDSGISSKKERLYQVNSLAKEYYHYVLTKHPAGKNALEYLSQRGVTPRVIETFTLGFAPATGTALVKYLIGKKRYTKEDVIDAGLAFQGRSGLVDFFRGRLMFPLFDHRDNVIGFSGRIMDNGNAASKYVNTRETLVYHKGDNFYGLNITKDAIKRESQAIIVEGEFDVISCFENGIGNVAGVKGTALTENQVNLLSRFTQKITFCFDGDKAGQEAIKRSLTVVEKKGLTPTVIEIPNGKDPDEALKKEAALFKKAVREDIGIYDYLLTKAIKNADVTTPEGKKQVSDQLLPILSHITNEIIKEHYLRKLSSELETSYESIVKEMQRLTKPTTVQIVKTAPKAKRDKVEVMEEYLISLIIQSENPKLLVEKVKKTLSDSIAKERASQKIMYKLLESIENKEQFNSKLFGDGLAKELVESYDTCLLLPIPEFESEDKLLDDVEKTARKLNTAYIQQQMKTLATEIKQKEEEGQEDELTGLRKQFSELVARLDTK